MFTTTFPTPDNQNIRDRRLCFWSLAGRGRGEESRCVPGVLWTAAAAIEFLIMLQNLKIFRVQMDRWNDFALRFRRDIDPWKKGTLFLGDGLIGAFRPACDKAFEFLWRHTKVAMLAPKSTVKLSPSFTVRAEP